jgi:hypothetical protein
VCLKVCLFEGVFVCVRVCLCVCVCYVSQLVRGLEEAMKEASIQAPPVSRRERATGVAAVARAAIDTCSPTPSLEFPVLDVGVGLVDVMRSLEGAVAGGVSRGA